MNESRRYKNAIYEQFARLGKATASPKRLELLDILCQGPRTVEALATMADISVANASQHLQVLRGARLVDAEKRGNHVEYRLAGDEVCAFFLSMRRLAEARLTEVERLTRDYLAGRDDLEPIDTADLIRRSEAGEIVVIDVRPTEEFAAGHLPGALSIPVDDLRRRLAELPADRTVVAYCRGPYCVMSVEAVAILREHGLIAQRLPDGPADWAAAGLPVATGLDFVH